MIETRACTAILSTACDLLDARPREVDIAILLAGQPQGCEQADSVYAALAGRPAAEIAGEYDTLFDGEAARITATCLEDPSHHHGWRRDLRTLLMLADQAFDAQRAGDLAAARAAGNLYVAFVASHAGRSLGRVAQLLARSGLPTYSLLGRELESLLTGDSPCRCAT